ncbi:tetratricopeptide repeat protein [Streptomyces sp. S.PB5]|uniref:tetratricopeptide repeat protein n=1 Tax=Streptomyces sp. S.PB5 TaxID=3020844 RepID=UPI00339D7959
MSGRWRPLYGSGGGEDHPNTLMSQNNLAVACWASGQVARALPLYERALAGYVRVLGEGHPTTRIVRDNLSAARAEEP